MCRNIETRLLKDFLIINSKLSKSDMIALKKRTMNFSYHLYNMMVFQKMARMPTKNKEKSSFTQRLYKPHGN